MHLSSICVALLATVGASAAPSPKKSPKPYIWTVTKYQYDCTGSVCYDHLHISGPKHGAHPAFSTKCASGMNDTDYNPCANNKIGHYNIYQAGEPGYYASFSYTYNGDTIFGGKQIVNPVEGKTIHFTMKAEDV